MAHALALVLERAREMRLREIDLPLVPGPDELRIGIRTVGICGSDLHYLQHGAIGPFVLRQPMVLGHEASGVVLEVGSAVRGYAVGDRVCIEPGVPRLDSPAVLRGVYNLDPSVRFWATPPVHGCLTPEVVHPALFTHKLPDAVSFAEGAFVEPLAIGLQVATKSRFKPGDVAVVLGAGTIGAMCTLAALAGGAAQVVLADPVAPKLARFAQRRAVRTVELPRESLADAVSQATGGWGADVVIEASGAAGAYAGISDLAGPGGCLVLVGMPALPVPLDIVALQAKELRVETVFRYANMFPRALQLLASGQVDVRPFISRRFAFASAIEAFEQAALGLPQDLKIQIDMPGGAA
ncbi:MAG: NAD(P)-dependent alcohol dehydrogenase [Rubrivivax sp.]|nr:NAD(P)-dependent alcohol dehydrogenase [Rubrivivax sp.]